MKALTLKLLLTIAIALTALGVSAGDAYANQDSSSHCTQFNRSGSTCFFHNCVDGPNGGSDCIDIVACIHGNGEWTFGSPCEWKPLYVEPVAIDVGASSIALR